MKGLHSENPEFDAYFKAKVEKIKAEKYKPSKQTLERVRMLDIVVTMKANLARLKG